jgi:lysophospholipase L1-like esterase
MRTVLCFGDSNTHGTLPMRDLDESRRLPRGERWPDVLAGHLGPGWDVVADGLPGRTTVHPDPVQGPLMEGIAVLDPILHAHRPLDLVVVMLGTNDLKARFRLSARDVAEGCGRIVRAILASDAGPGGGAPAALLVCPPPIVETRWSAEMFAGGAATSRALPGHMERIAAAAGAAFFDAGTVIASDPVDGIHAGRDSHRTLGAALAGPVRAAINA